MVVNKLHSMLMIAGSLVATLGLVWFLIFYVQAVQQFENGSFADVVNCLYSYSEQCQIVNRSIALMGETPAYNPAVFLGGLVVLVVGIALKFLRRDG